MRAHRDDYTRYEVDSDEDDSSEVSGYPDEMPRVVPKSAITYRTTETHAATRTVSQRRASAIPARASRTRLDVVPGPPPRRQANRRTTETLPRRWRLHPLLVVGLALLIALLGYVALTSVLTWAANTENHWQYGYPRTAQYDVVVGHDDNTTHPSHFLVPNDHGQIYVIEFPGGDVSHARIYAVGALVGQDAALVPVTLSFRDVNGDGKLDMIVIAGSIQYVFLNEGGQFVKTNP